MRITALILAFLACIVVGNLAVSAVYPPYREAIRQFRGAPPVEKVASNQNSPQISDEKILESLSRMNSGLDALMDGSGSVNNTTATGTESLSWTAKVSKEMFSTGLATASKDSAQAFKEALNASASLKATVNPPVQKESTPSAPVEKVFPISGLILARLMPDIFPKKTENKGIFNLHIFDSIEYSTYLDTKSGLKLYAFAETYDVMLSNLKLVSAAYTINETDTFFSNTFFLNPTNKKDTTIRFVLSLEWKAIGFEMPKALYSKIKKMLLQP